MIDLSVLEIILVFVSVVLALVCLALSKKVHNLKETIKTDKTILQAYTQLEDRFKNISNELFIKNQEIFLNLAKENFDKVVLGEKRELDKKQNDFNNIIRPIQETLLRFDNQVSSMEKSRISAYSELTQQVQNIRKETSRLNSALSNPIATGKWGELQLRRVVEMAGMLNYCDFVEQKQAEDSRARPDMIINLPGNRNVIVDSKAPIEAYMKAINTGDDSLIDKYVSDIKSHIKKLSQKQYWKSFSQTPEFVIMFIPGESFFSAALKNDPALVEFGAKEKIIIATPVSLIAILKSISFAWHQEAVNKNAIEISKIGRDVFDQMQSLIKETQSFGSSLKKTVEKYDDITDIINRKIIPTSQKLNNLRLETNQDDENHEVLN